MISAISSRLASWQQRWRQGQPASVIGRLFAWLLLGVAMLLSLALLLFLLLLSWLLIPLMLWRARRRARQMQQPRSHATAGTARVIEGEVLDKHQS